MIDIEQQLWKCDNILNNMGMSKQIDEFHREIIRETYLTIGKIPKRAAMERP